MNFGQAAKSVLATVAPLLAVAIPGPFGGLASSLLSKALGTSDPKAIEAAIASTDPDVLLKLKQADSEFATQMKALQISEEKLSYDDIANARSREIQVKDKTPMILAFVITLGFFGTLLFMLFKGTPTSGGEALLVLLGSLATAWAGVVTYFFGSSAGSATKDKTISDIAKQS